MTEAVWLACGAPTALADCLSRSDRRPTERKLRLFLIALWRRFHAGFDWAAFGDPHYRGRMADGFEAAERLAEGLHLDKTPRWLFTMPELWPAINESLAHSSLPSVVPPAEQVELLRDIFGNPFRPVAFPPEWRTDTAMTLARQMYDSCEFSAMPILADALQDTGCENEHVLNHCRGPGPHVRGCWVVDLALGRE